MPKAITSEMLEAMTPAQITILHANANSIDSSAARDLLHRLVSGGFVKPPKLAKSSISSLDDGPAKTAKSPKVKKALTAHGRRA